MKFYYQLAFFLVAMLTSVVTFSQGGYPDCSYGETLLNKLPVTVMGVSGAGAVDDPRGSICFAETNSHWFRFRCTASGSFEFMITALGKEGANFDFALMKACPCSGNPQIMFCNNASTAPPPKIWTTGLSADPFGTFGVLPTTFEWFFTSANLVAGQNYYLLVNNTTGNGEGFNIRFAGTAQIGQILPQQNLTSTLIGPPDLLCPGEASQQNFKVSTPGNFGTDLTYFWEVIPGGSGLNYLALIDGIGPFINTEIDNVNIDFLQFNTTYTVKCTITDECTGSISTGTKNIKVLKIINDKDSIFRICDEDGTYRYDGVDYGPGVNTIDRKTNEGCYKLNIIIDPYPVNFKEIGKVPVCRTQTYSVCGSSFTYKDEGVHTEVSCPGKGLKPPQSCDTFLIFDIIPMLIEPKINFTDTTFRCPKDSVLMSACLSTFVPKDSTVISYAWRRNGIVIPGAKSCTYLAKQPGIYNADISITYTYYSELAKTHLTKTCTESVKITVNPSTVVAPPEPIFTPDAILCFGEIQKFTVQNPEKDGIYTWIYNNDTIKTQKGPVANILMTALGGKVCVFVTNLCKLSSSVACQDIRANLKPAKPVITGDNLLCNGKSGNYCVSNYSNLYSYDWTVPLGASLNTNNSKCVTINFGTLSGFQDICVKATNECGSVDTCFQVELKNVPPATTEIFGNKATCFNDTTSYWVTPVSTATGYEWTIVGGTIVSGTTKDSVKVVWQSVGNGSICLKSSNICGSSPDYCQNIVVSEKAKILNIAGKNSLCERSSGTYSISTLNSNELIFWTVSNGTITSGQGTKTIEVLWDQALVNNKVCYDLTNECGTVQNCLSTTVVPLPKSKVGAAQKVCGLSTNLNAIPDVGTGIWTFLSGPNSNVSFNNALLSNALATVDQCGTYQFKWTENNQGCKDSALYSVTFIDNPKAVFISEDCNPAQTQYAVSLNVSGCAAAYQIKDLNTNGITNLNVAPYKYTSGFIVENTPYRFQITDNEGCKSDTITGIKKCNCPSKAGTMSANLIEVCQNATGTATQNAGTQNLEIDDTFEFVLHDNNGTQLGTIFARNQSGIFGYLPALQFEKIYYISYIVGNKLGAQVDLTDPCLSVSVGQPIVFHKIPKPNAGPNNAFCGLSGQLAAVPELGSGNWKLLIGPGVVLYNNLNLPDTKIDVSVFGTYTFEWLDNNQGCIGKDTVVVTFRPDNLSASAPTYTCATDGQSYVATFTLTGGNPPYSVNGNPIVGNIFNSANIGTGINDTFTITDNFKCSTTSVPVFKICDCKSRASSLTQVNPVLCKNDVLTVSGTFVKDPNDDHEYVLADKCDIQDPAITIYARNKTGNFSLLPNMSCGTDYQIILLVGNPVPATGFINLQDPCLDTKCITVRFDCYPVVNAGVNKDNCGLNASLNGTINSGSIQWKSLGNSNVLFSDVTALNSLINVPGCGKFPFELTGNFKGCLSKDTVEYIFNTPPVLTNLKASCDNTNTNYTVTFDISACSPTYAVTGMNGGTLNNNQFTSNLISGFKANYTFVVTDPLGCVDSISGEQICDCYTTSGTLPANLLKTCVTAQGIGSISTKSNNDFVVDANDTYEYILTDDLTGSTLGLILDRNKSGVFNYKPGIIFGKTYYIVFAVGDSLINGQVNLSAANKCLALTSQPIQFFECPELNCQNDTIVDCNLSTTLKSNGLVGKGIWTIVQTPLNAVANIGSLTAENTTVNVDQVGAYRFRRIQTNDIFADTCDVGVTFRITKAPTIIANSTQFTTSCKDTSYTVSFQFTGVGPFQILPSSSAGTFVGNQLTSGLIKSESGYKFVVKDRISCDSMIVEGTYKTNCKSNAGTKIRDLVICQPTDTIIDLFELIAGEEKIGSWAASPAVNGSPEKFQTRFAAPGTYTFTYIIPDKLTPPSFEGDTSVVLITINPAPVADAGKDQLITCSVTNAPLGGDNTSIGGQFTYQWTGGQVSNPVIKNPTTNQNGTFVLSVINSQTGCASRDTILITSKNVKPTAIAKVYDISCPGNGDGSIFFKISDGTAPYTFKYQQTAGNVIVGDSLRFSALKPGTYSLSIKDVNDCTWDTTITINQPKPITVDLGNDFTILLGDTATVKAKIINYAYPTDIDTVKWAIRNVDTLINGIEFKVIPTISGEYCIYVKNKNGCEATDCIYIGVETKYPVFIPNAFSPNNDMHNDRFVIYGDPRFVKSVEQFAVFDRWGNQLHYAQNFQPGDETLGWDGNFNGKKMNPGVYVYHAKILFIDGTTKVLKGDVTLIDRD